jgi:chromosome segregation ATPase
MAVLEPNKGGRDARLDAIFASFDDAWLKYWESYVRLQDQLYESLRAGREVSWLAATDERKLSEINQVQRELFSGMPRRLDYSPLGQITRDLGSAQSKISELEAALTHEEEGCKSLEAAIALMKEKVEAMKQAMRTASH